MGLSTKWLALFVCVYGVAAFSQQLRVSTFNIRWYGDGEEVRDVALRKALKAELSKSDVIVFEEIVDVARLKKNLIQGKMECKTYDRRGTRHQHVVLCHKPQYAFAKEEGEDNYEMEAVAETSPGGRGRPALYGVLKNSSGKKIAHLIGVHLKAFPQETEKRLTQAEEIAKVVGDFEDDLPVIMTGDFNTYPAELTKQKKDDNKLILEKFDEYEVGLREVHNPYKYTYMSAKHGSKFDRFYVSEGVAVVENAKPTDPCQNPSKQSAADIKWYNDNISDHCMVSVTLDLTPALIANK